MPISGGRGVLVLLLLCISGLALAKPVEREFAQTLHGYLTFYNVERILRVPSVGLYEGGPVRLQPWVEVGEKAFLGIDQNGRLLQVIKTEKAPVAFVLSGDHKMRDLFFDRVNQRLYAIDINGQLYLFDWTMWQGDRTEYNRRLKRIPAIVVPMAVIANIFTSNTLGIPFYSEPALLSGSLVAVTATGLQAIALTHYFERWNNATDGLKPLNSLIIDYRGSEFVRDESGAIVDYRLLGRESSISLMSRIPPIEPSDSVGDFDYKCEHELLPRGIAPSRYEP